MDQSYVRHLLIRLSGKVDLEHAHPHAFRHSYAAGLAREGTPMNVIRDALGHTSLATTDRYLRAVAPVHVIETMRQRDWTGKPREPTEARMPQFPGGPQRPWFS